MSEQTYTELVVGGIYAQVGADGTHTGHQAVCIAAEPGKHGRCSLFTFEEGQKAPLKGHPSANEWKLIGNMMDPTPAEVASAADGHDILEILDELQALKQRVEGLETLLAEKAVVTEESKTTRKTTTTRK